MPVINREVIKEKKIEYKKESSEQSADFYNSMAWKRLRNTYLSTHPLCQICLDHNRVTPATDIHHRIPWDRGNSEEEKWSLFLNESNLIACCETCHYALHYKDRQYHMGSLDELTQTEYNYAHRLNY